MKKQKKKKRKNIVGIIFSSFGFIFSIAGAIDAGGAIDITFGIVAIFNNVTVGITSWNIFYIKNQIKEFSSILQKANNEYEIFEKVIESFLEV